MRRPTLIALIVLFVVLVTVAVIQLRIATQDQEPFPGPTSPGQLPTESVTPTSDPAESSSPTSDPSEGDLEQPPPVQPAEPR